MKKFLFVLMMMLFSRNSIADKYPLHDTDFLIGAYCFHMSLAPRLETDLSTKEKEKGQEKYYNQLIGKNLEFPKGEKYKEIRDKFAVWSVTKFKSDDQKEILRWYKSTCLK